MKPDYQGNNWAVYNADCVELLMGLPDDSIDCAVFSSPFSSLYIYSDSERDMGNSASHEEFLEHHRYMARELYRVIKPGAVICDHVLGVAQVEQGPQLAIAAQHDVPAASTIATVRAALGHVLLAAQVPGSGPSLAAPALDANVVNEIHAGRCAIAVPVGSSPDRLHQPFGDVCDAAHAVDGLELALRAVELLQGRGLLFIFADPVAHHGFVLVIGTTAGGTTSQ